MQTDDNSKWGLLSQATRLSVCLVVVVMVVSGSRGGGPGGEERSMDQTGLSQYGLGRGGERVYAARSPLVSPLTYPGTTGRPNKHEILCPNIH